jgi:hypothetical protein
MSGFIRSWWPIEHSAPSDVSLILTGTLPFLVGTILLHWAGVAIWARFPLAVVVALAIRVLPWFKRPESYHFNALVGWVAGEVVGLLIWGHP